VLVVVLGVAVMIIAIVALREPKGHVAAQRTASSVAKQSSTTPSPSRSVSHRAATSTAPHRPDTNSSAAAKALPLIVLNNTTVPGLAQQAATRFQAGGWTVTRYDNYQNDILSTCAYYDPSVTGAKAAAEALQQQFPEIKRVKERFSDLPQGPIVVVLTPDYTQG
jgi:hypothetical protein